jgi:hypothetical protein
MKKPQREKEYKYLKCPKLSENSVTDDGYLLVETAERRNDLVVKNIITRNKNITDVIF